MPFTFYFYFILKRVHCFPPSRQQTGYDFFLLSPHRKKITCSVGSFHLMVSPLATRIQVKEEENVGQSPRSLSHMRNRERFGGGKNTHSTFNFPYIVFPANKEEMWFLFENRNCRMLLNCSGKPGFTWHLGDFVAVCVLDSMRALPLSAEPNRETDTTGASFIFLAMKIISFFFCIVTFGCCFAAALSSNYLDGERKYFTNPPFPLLKKINHSTDLPSVQAFITINSEVFKSSGGKHVFRQLEVGWTGISNDNDEGYQISLYGEDPEENPKRFDHK